MDNIQVNQYDNHDQTNEKEYSHKKKKQFLAISLFLFIGMLIEYFTRDISKQYTIKWFGGKGKERCSELDHFEFYSFGGRYILLFLIMTYVNIPAGLSYIFLDCFGVFINGIFRFFYFDDRPFWVHPEYTPCFCAIDYGNPSTTGINTFLMFAVFYKCFTYKSTNKIFKYSLFFVCAANIIYVMVIRMLQNIHYFHQLLYGFILGYYIYYIYFEILEINFDNKDQFISILEKWKGISFLTIIAWSTITFIHIKLNLQPPNKEVIQQIEKNCSLVPLFAFDHESYTKSVRIFEFLGCFIGSYLEYVLIFGYDKDKFLQYNVISQEKMYTKTHCLISLLRFLVFFIIQNYLLSNIILGKKNFDNFWNLPLVQGLIIQQVIPLFIHGLCVFFLIKILVRYLWLTNEKVWENEIEKIECREEEDKLFPITLN